MSELARKLIREAKETGAKRLDLGKCALKYLPEELFELTDLEELILSNRYWDYGNRKWMESQNNDFDNTFDLLPPNLSRLKKIRLLKVGGDYTRTWKISDISVLKSLEQLQTLDLRSNQISDIKPLVNFIRRGVVVSVKQFDSRQKINLYENPLQSPPPEIVEKGNKAILNYFEELSESNPDRLYEAKVLLVGEG